MKIENTDVWGFDHALRGMRNPKESWNKSDTTYCGFNDNIDCDICPHGIDNCPIRYMGYNCGGIIIGKNDMDLCKRLIKGGSEHRKFLRQIMVSVDITAPLYWWKEFDTYKVGITVNSTSTMHKITSKPITLDCFEINDFKNELKVKQSIDYEYPQEEDLDYGVGNHIYLLEQLRLKYIETKDVRYWKELIRWLPESWLQTRTCTMNYENLMNMYHQRKNHKLIEWHTFCDWVLTLPYMKEFLEGAD